MRWVPVGPNGWTLSLPVRAMRRDAEDTRGAWSAAGARFTPTARPDIATAIAAMSISNGTLTIRFLPDATAGQRNQVPAILTASPLIAVVQEQKRQS